MPATWNVRPAGSYYVYTVVTLHPVTPSWPQWSSSHISHLSPLVFGGQIHSPVSALQLPCVWAQLQAIGEQTFQWVSKNLSRSPPELFYTASVMRVFVKLQKGKSHVCSRCVWNCSSRAGSGHIYRLLRQQYTSTGHLCRMLPIVSRTGCICTPCSHRRC